MVKKFISKADLARLCNITGAVITRHVKGDLKDAVEGRRINVNHPSVQKFIKDREPQGPAQGIDPLYQNAIDFCTSQNEFSANAVRRGLKIGMARATRIFAMMHAAGIIKPAKKVPPPPPPLSKGIQSTTKTKKHHALAALNERVDDASLEHGTMIHEIPEDIKAFIHMTLEQIIKRFGTDTAFCDWLKAVKSIEDINEKRLKNATTRGELVSRDLVKVGVIDQINTTFQKLLTDGAKSITVKITTMTKAGMGLNECEKTVVDQIESFIRPAKTKMIRNLKNL